MAIQIIIKISFTTTHTMNKFVLKKINKNYCSSLYFFQKKFKELENNIWEIDELNNLINKESCFGKLCFKNKSIVGFCIGNLFMSFYFSV